MDNKLKITDSLNLNEPISLEDIIGNPIDDEIISLEDIIGNPIED